MLVLSLKALPGMSGAIAAYQKLNIRFACEVMGQELICVFDVTEIRLETLKQIMNIGKPLEAIDITSELSLQRVAEVLKKVS